MKRLLIVFMVIVLSYCSVTAQSKKSKEDESYFLKKVLSEQVYFADKQVKIDTLRWNPHPAFKGVYLKNLISSQDTDGRLSCHIVKIEPGCILDTHQHDGKIEIHEVVQGDGTMQLKDQKISYSVGKTCVIPANTLHKVVAGRNGMYLFAKFIPAL